MKNWQQPSLDFFAPAPDAPPDLPPLRAPKVTSHFERLKASRQPSLFDLPPAAEPIPETLQSDAPKFTTPSPVHPDIASGEKAKALDIINAIKTLKQIEAEERPATDEERIKLARFAGFGPVALSIFPDPITGKTKDGWSHIARELQNILTSEEYDSVKRTTFNAFYTSPTVMTAMHEGLARLGLPENATILEPGCGVGRFMCYGKPARYIGVELDSISGRIAKAIHPHQDIRIENFRDTRLPQLDAVIGNVPFADIKLDHKGQRFALHDYFFAKSIDSLKPGGVLALVTSHYTLDKQNAAIREYIGEQADFLGAIRLPCDAFKKEGTAVVTDIIFLRKRAPGESARHEEAEWQRSRPFEIEGAEIPINRYFVRHPEMVLGNWTRKDTLYGDAGYSVTSNGDLAEQLKTAIERLPKRDAARAAPQIVNPAPVSRAPLPTLAEGSFFVRDDNTICQTIDGEAHPVTERLKTSHF